MISLVAAAAPLEKRIRVVVVAENAGEREQLSEIIGGSRRFRLTGSHAAARGAQELDDQTPDVIIGYAQDELSFETFQKIARKFADVPSLLIISGLESLRRLGVDEAINAVAEVAGLSDHRAVIRNLKAVSNDNQVTGVAVEEAQESDDAKLASLTAKEREVLKLAAEGLSIKETAARLNRAYGTVASHRASVMQKIGIHDKVGLTRFAIRTGLVMP